MPVMSYDLIDPDAVEPPGLGGTERAMVTDRWR